MIVKNKQILTNSEFLNEISECQSNNDCVYINNLKENTNEKLVLIQLSKFELSIEEKLQLVNNKPINLIKLYLILNNINNRFSKEEIKKILQIIK